MAWRKKTDDPPRGAEDPFARLERAILRMQEPSWAILSALDPTHARPGIELLDLVEAMYRASDYPRRRLDPSTLHYALRRMEQDGLVTCDGEREVEVPGPWETRIRQTRPVYRITGYGQMALDRHARLYAQMHPADVSLVSLSTATDRRL
jgi:DNA-binding PadR family transcriptional regulator